MSEHSYEHPIRHADPREGFDRREPAAGAIAAAAIASVIVLIVVILALQSYFDHIWQEAVYEKILAPPSEQLQELHNREDWQLTHYQYVDKQKGQVRIPVDRAMTLFVQEAASGKLFYPAKPAAPKPEVPAAASAAGQTSAATPAPAK